MMTVVAAVSGPLNGQASENDEPVFDAGAGIVLPKVIHQVNPKPDSCGGASSPPARTADP